MSIETHPEPRRFEPDGPVLMVPDALSRRYAARVRPAMGQDGWSLPYGMVGDVAVVSVDGPLMQRGSNWWFDGYDAVCDRVKAALAEPKARAVVMKLNSPGGMAAGCFESVRSMRSMARASGKPVYAYADEQACSGAYALACVASKIFLPAAGEVGSVGVLGGVVSYRAAMEAEGVDFRVVRSDAMKALGHPADPITDEALAREQADVNELAVQFRALVAEARSMTPAQVAALEADTRMGAAAVTAGLADGVCTFDECVARASGAAVSTNLPPLASVSPVAQHHNPTKGASTMTEEERRKLEAYEALQRRLGVTSPDELEAAVSAQGREAARAKDLDAELSTSREAAAKTAREAEATTRSAMLATAQREGRLSKADMADETYQKELAGFTSAQLKTHLSRLTPRAAALPGKGKHTPAVNAAVAVATSADAHVAKVMGFSPEQRAAMAKIRAEEAARGAEPEPDDDAADDAAEGVN